MERSINDLAACLSASPRTIRRIIARLKAADPNLVIGRSLGAGKATMLTEAEQELIKENYSPRGEDTIETQIQPYPEVIQDAYTLQPVTGDLALYQGAALDAYKLPDLEVLPTVKHISTEEFVEAEMSKLDAFLSLSTATTEQLDRELIEHAIQRGAKRGTVLAQIEIAAAEKQRTAILTTAAKKQGLEVQ